MKIGLIGVGMVGGPLSELWASAGHEVFVSSRHPARLVAPPGGRKGLLRLQNGQNRSSYQKDISWVYI